MFILHNFFENLDKFFILEIFILFFILITLLFVCLINILTNRFFYPILSSGLIILSIFVILISLFLIIEFLECDFIFANFRFIFDTYSFLSRIFILFFAFNFFIVSYVVSKLEFIRLVEYFVVVWLSILSMTLLTTSIDFFFIFLILELQSLSLYVLATFNYTSLYSTEAGLKYFTLSTYSTGFVIFGIALLYGLTGTTNFDDLRLFFMSTVLFDEVLYYIAIFSILLILSGLLFKLSAAPFHF
jgi:NADH-quinone oxidoreductase subunit N